MNHFGKLLMLCIAVSSDAAADIVYQEMEPINYQVPVALNSDGLVVKESVTDYAGITVNVAVIGLVDICHIENSLLLGYQEVVLFSQDSDVSFGDSEQHAYPIIKRESISLPCSSVMQVDLTKQLHIEPEQIELIRAALVQSGKVVY